MPLPSVTRDSFDTFVGNRVRFHRKNIGMDQETLARHLNLSRTTIINIEKGRQRLSLEHAWLAAQVLMIAVDDLLPHNEADSINEWNNVLNTADVSRKDKKGVMKWISKIKEIEK